MTAQFNTRLQVSIIDMSENGPETDGLSQCRVRTFTWRELSVLRHGWNAHVAYQGKVYDVSSFVARHPGGAEQILAGAGRDITQVFKSYHKSDTFERVLSKYYVGELVDNELPVFPSESKLYDLVKQRITEYTKAHNLDPKIDYRMFLTYFVTVFVYLLSLYFLILYNHSLLWSIVFAAIRGIMSTLVGGMHHDSSHFAVTHNPRVWKIGRTVSASLIGISSYVWYYQHIIGHHSYTNIEGVDPDIDTGAAEEKIGYYRIKKSQHWTKYFMYQHLYMPALYCLQTMRMKISDFKFVLSQMMIGRIRMNPLDIQQWLEFWITKLVHLLITCIIPLYFMPLARVVLCTVVFEVTCSLSFTQLVQLNHVSDEVSFPKPDRTTNRVKQDWAELQVAATQDYCTDSWFWTTITCALNHQTAHHLFPGYIQSHYRWITPIIKQTCAELNIKYNSADSITEALGLHYKFLRRMGQKKQS